MGTGDTPRITTTEMHTGGEPVRIVESGYPSIPGATILDKREYVRANLDHLRTRLMFEPRGHFDMYGVIPVEPDLPEADLAVLFMHNEGYSTMCGHAVIALGRYAVDTGLVDPVEPETRLVIQCPCGPVVVHVDVRDGVSGAARFESVGAFAHSLGRSVVIGDSRIDYDIGYGGAFYTFADSAQFGLDVTKSPASELAAAATALTAAVNDDVSLDHPDAPELAFLYGTILTDGIDDGSLSSNVCVFADSQIDRSPTGSGVTARMALRFARDQVDMGQVCEFSSIVGSKMTGRVVSTHPVGTYEGVVVEVGGHAFYTGSATFSIEPDDPFGPGFLVR